MSQSSDKSDVLNAIAVVTAAIISGVFLLLSTGVIKIPANFSRAELHGSEATATAELAQIPSTEFSPETKQATQTPVLDPMDTAVVLPTDTATEVILPTHTATTVVLPIDTEVMSPPGTAIADAIDTAIADATGTAIADATGTAVADATGTAVADAIDTPVVQPTKTAIARVTKTPVGDTPPGTILEPGEVWRAAGLELVVNFSEFTQRSYPGGAIVKVQLTNRRESTFSYKWSPANFSAVDNNGEPLEVSAFGPLSPDAMRVGATYGLLEPGESTYYNYGYLDSLLIRFDLTDANVTHVIFSISDFSTIGTAEWQILAPSH